MRNRFYDGLRYKTPYINEPDANQIKEDITTEVTVDQCLTATGAQRRITNKASDG